MDDKYMYSELPLFAEWSYKGYQCRIVDVDSDPGECYKTAAFVVKPDGTLHRVPITTYNIKRQLIEMWIDAECPLEKTRYDESELAKLKATREKQSMSKTASVAADSQHITITLRIDSWKVIMEFIRVSCQSRGNDWIKWGQEVNQTVQSAIDKSTGVESVKGIKRTSIYSSNLNSVGYDVKTKTLEIQFNDGSIYQYYKVPQLTYKGLMKAESHGVYFQDVIRDSFQYRKVGDEPLNSIQKRRINRFNDDLDYDSDYPEEAHTTEDLKNDLGMDFMSNNEFDDWLEDHTGGRD